MTKYRRRSRDMRLRVPKERAPYENDEFLASYHGFEAGSALYECANDSCLDRWIQAPPEVSWLIGGKWHYFHYECQPRDGNLALEYVGICPQCGTPIPLTGWGPRAVQGGGGFVSRTSVCPKCVAAYISIGRMADDGDVRDGGGVRGVVRGEQQGQRRLPARTRALRGSV